MKFSNLGAVALLLSCCAITACSSDPEVGNTVTIDFEGINMGAEHHIDNLEYTVDGATFYNFFDTYGDFSYWGGFAYSCLGGNEYSTLADQYLVYNANGFTTQGAGHKSNNFALVFPTDYPCDVTFAQPTYVRSMYINNTAYVVNAITVGDAFARKFADGDWYKLTVTGMVIDKPAMSGQPATYKDVYNYDFYLADFRKGKKMVVTDWTLFDDMASAQAVDKIHFSVSSTDVGEWGMNTPGYFALDDLTIEPATTLTK